MKFHHPSTLTSSNMWGSARPVQVLWAPAFKLQFGGSQRLEGPWAMRGSTNTAFFLPFACLHQLKLNMGGCGRLKMVLQKFLGRQRVPGQAGGPRGSVGRA